MTTRTQIRFITGALCLFLAITVALVDFFLSSQGSPLLQSSKTEKSESVDESVPEEDACLTEEGEPCPVDETLQILRGDTLSTVLSRAKINGSQTYEMINALEKVFNPRDLRPEHELYIAYIPVRQNPEMERDLIKLYIRPSLEEEIIVERTEKGYYRARKEEKALTHELKVVRGVVQESLYLDAGRQGVPARILHGMIKAFSFDIDFQRSFQKGDEYGLIYDTYTDPDSLREESGDLAFAYLKLRGQELRLYRFQTSKGPVGYYNAKGESVKKGLLRTPIDGARISSGFGRRKHPILGYSKMHKGVDFAAPRGTPIMAAGDGLIEKAALWSSYGNYIRIKHNGEYSTAYAHLSRYAKGIKAGKRVRQGQVIGYVGATGRAKGAHLHYELLKHGKQVNPKHIKSLPAGKLTQKDLKLFKALKTKIDRQFEEHQVFKKLAKKPGTKGASSGKTEGGKGGDVLSGSVNTSAGNTSASNTSSGPASVVSQNSQ